MAWAMRHGPDLEFLGRVATKRIAERVRGLRDDDPAGDVPDALRSGPSLLPGAESLFLAWLELHQQRGCGFAPEPIRVEAVESWARMAGWPEPARRHLLRAVLACERGWREVEQERAKRDKEARVDGRGPRS